MEYKPGGRGGGDQQNPWLLRPFLNMLNIYEYFLLKIKIIYLSRYELESLKFVQQAYICAVLSI